MTSQLTNRITLYVATTGAVLVVGVLLIGGTVMGGGAAVGAGVALVNWLALRFIVRRVMQGDTKQRAFLMLLLVAKMAALMALCWALVARWGVDPVGFIIGLSALFVGMGIGATAVAPMANEQTAGEEG